jgi:arginase family enzyme
MQIRVLDLDGSVTQQIRVMDRYRPSGHNVAWWGPRIRLGCSFRRFRQFEKALARELEDADASSPSVTLYGSGDFHHVSLALLRRLPGPVNLLVLDNHPDWMRAVPFLHCGTWLYHAARLPQVQQVFHVGGDVDFDNSFRRLAPWPLLHSGKVAVFPGRRSFCRGAWSRVRHERLRLDPRIPVNGRRLDRLLETYRATLARYPLYISLDKDVLGAAEATVNWDSGHLSLREVEDILRVFLDAAHANLAGIDIVGDWSPVQTRGLLRRLLHWTEHPSLRIDPVDANTRNERTNLSLLNLLSILCAAAPRPLVRPIAA